MYAIGLWFMQTFNMHMAYTIHSTSMIRKYDLIEV